MPYTPRSPQRQQLFKKFAEELVSIWAPKPNNPANQYVERDYETEAFTYLRKLYQELNQKNEKNFLNRKLREFQRNAPSLSVSPKAKEIIESKLKQLRIYNQLLRNTTNTQRRRSRTRSNFSNASKSNTNSSASLLSLQTLRNNTKNYEEPVRKRSWTPRRRLQGKVVSPKPQSQEEV